MESIQLSTELWCMIIEFTSLEDYVTMTRVSKGFRMILERFSYLWTAKNLIFEETNPSLTHRIECAIARIMNPEFHLTTEMMKSCYLAISAKYKKSSMSFLSWEYFNQCTFSFDIVHGLNLRFQGIKEGLTCNTFLKIPRRYVDITKNGFLETSFEYTTKITHEILVEFFNAKSPLEIILTKQKDATFLTLCCFKNKLVMFKNVAKIQ